MLSIGHVHSTRSYLNDVKITLQVYLVGGWTTHLKNMLVKLEIFLKFRGENGKNIWNHHNLPLTDLQKLLLFVWEMIPRYSPLLPSHWGGSFAGMPGTAWMVEKKGKDRGVSKNRGF